MSIDNDTAMRAAAAPEEKVPAGAKQINDKETS
jgi:hypothetical protein